jgi:hypothetical protein
MQSIRKLDASARVKHYFSVRYRTKPDRSSWSEEKQGDAMIPNLVQRPNPIPRTFAELPAGNWTDILCHARDFYGASNVGLFGEGDDRSWVCFEYRSYHFCITESSDGSRVTLSVDDEHCDYEVLLEVQRHFAAMLYPIVVE